jgi:hypothetical protein
MDVAGVVKTVKIRRWLPYWAVLQADVRQTLRSWIYRGAVLAALIAAIGYLLYRIGVYREAGIIQSASSLISDLLRWSVLGGVALVTLVTAGSISSERGILADSVLSRGISRYQYFLGKWHARIVIVLGTFLTIGLVACVGSYLFLDAHDLSIVGSLVGLLIVLILLAAAATCGVATSALCNSTMLGVAILWILLYGAGFGMAFLPSHYPTPDRAISNLPHIVRGLYDVQMLRRLIEYAAGGSLLVALVGLAQFARRDV